MRPGVFNWPERHKNAPSSLRLCAPNQRLQTAVDRRLRRNGPAFESQLTERERGMSQPQLRRLPKARRKLVQSSLAFEQPQRLQLGVGRPARADEIRLVGVREPVRARLRLTDDGPLVEHEGGVA